jgi:hypothetical protein
MAGFLPYKIFEAHGFTWPSDSLKVLGESFVIGIEGAFAGTPANAACQFARLVW